ncbi:MAG: DUF1294 domain-containing protein [Chloroflexi bacterium]|nr:DUF1294 domain-containing protein [Chloroflexota bacterium]
MELFFIPLSFITFLLLGYDKFQAKNDGWRVPEKVLLSLGIFGGAIGGLLGMRVFHHKTRKNYFWVTYGLAAVVHIALVLFLNK